MTYLPLAVGSIMAAWAMLALLGGERERRLGEMPPLPAEPANKTSAPSAKPSPRKADNGKPVR